MDRRIYRGRIFELVRRRLRKRGRWVDLDVVVHPGAVAVVPLLPGGRVALIRQWRGTIGRNLYEIVAGTREPGERPAASARRELVEEVGLAAGRLRKLTAVYTAPGFVTELIHVYAATGCREVGARPEADEFLERVDVPMATALRWIRSGRICDAKSIVGLTLAANL
jgi:ADP-ribose pyrophosphatase